jgi:hypothetical protein
MPPKESGAAAGAKARSSSKERPEPSVPPNEFLAGVEDGPLISAERATTAQASASSSQVQDAASQRSTQPLPPKTVVLPPPSQSSAGAGEQVQVPA